MIKNHYILINTIPKKVIWSAFLGAMVFSIVPFKSVTPVIVQVFAGNDTYTCINENLNLASLNASIQGDGVTNGDWITLGDGRFTPSNTSIGRFSTAVTYIPGPNDRSLGYYKLLLIADPSAQNPNERERDEVKITFNSAPPIICSANISISLNENCTQKVEVNMLNPNPQQPYSQYIISLFDKDGKPIPNQTITKAHLGQEVSYKLGHSCTSNICWGKIQVKDYFPPTMICANDTIKCLEDISPDSLGWPFPSTASIDTFINGSYIVKDWDACSDVSLHYVDEITKVNCLSDLDKKIKRVWTASDAHGNVSYCEQYIEVKRTLLSDIIFPTHFDGLINPIFECGDTFPILANGFPSPDTTGVPLIGSCSHLQFNMTDIPFDLCGKSKKIVRSWFVIDWCTAMSRSENQFIYMMDTTPPDIECKDTIRVFTSPYGCYTGKVLVEGVTLLNDCNTTTFNIALFNDLGIPANQYLEKEDTLFYVNKLPIGLYNVQYTVKDVCNNSASCVAVLIVEDKIAPFVACDQLTRVTLTDVGTAVVLAKTFDDNSIDNCGIATYRVRRMNESCGQNTGWSDRVLFCCEDIGTPQRVALEVTDVHGNRNTCMVDVVVDDKITPTITCPPTLTIECSESYQPGNLVAYGSVRTSASEIRPISINNAYHSGVVGQDGIASDACEVSIEETVVENVTCFTGNISRIFKATDKYGNTSSCTQTIYIQNPRPFDEANITWPKDFVGNDCRPTDLTPEKTGKPIFTNTSCATVSAAYQDQIFYIADGACIKIIRTWEVVDWCQYKKVGDPGRFGPYTQIIKIHNTDAPYFIKSCKDTIVCSYDADCEATQFIFDPVAEDACTAIDQLKWSYELDLDDDGGIDSLGGRQGIDIMLSMGRHRITYTVTDQCGNASTCSHIVDIVDCKKPTPYCLGSLSTSINAQEGSAIVWARDFDKGSYDNCSQDLKFVFGSFEPVKNLITQRHYFKGKGMLADSLAYIDGQAQVWNPQTSTSGMYFDCQDLIDGKAVAIPLSMTIIDNEGNKDSCLVTLHIDDSSDACPNTYKEGTIQGHIATYNNVIIKDVDVFISSTEGTFLATYNDSLGDYVSGPLSLDRPYTIKPKKKDDLIDGVSTLDLVKIQRHILGMLKLDSPYKLIAADINQSASVTASDLVELRKIILGINNQFPKGGDPWVFVPKEHKFADNNAPFYFPTEIELASLDSTVVGQDFVAIHRGDVDGSAKGSISENTVESRNGNYIHLETYSEKDQKQWKTNIIIPQSTLCSGFEMTIVGSGISHVISDMPDCMVHALSEDTIKIIYFPVFTMPFEASKILAEVYSSSPNLYLAVDQTNEFYDEDLYIKNVLISHGQTQKITDEIKLRTNPVFKIIRMISNHDEKIEFKANLINQFGQIVAGWSNFEILFDQGEYQMILPETLPSQYYTLLLNFPDGTQKAIPIITIR